MLDLSLAITFALSVVLLFLPRKWAVHPLLLTAVFLPMGQALMVSGLDFTMIRVLLFFCWARVLLRGEWKGFSFNRWDAAFTVSVASMVITYSLLHGTQEALVNRLGNAYNAMGIYFFVRIQVENRDQILALFKTLAASSSLLAAAMVVEYLTGYNVFSVFGGVPDYSIIREGRLRCLGSFAHPILAGTFGAVHFPFFYHLYRTGASRALGVIGMASAVVIVATSVSSGPVMSFGFGLVCLLLWRWRDLLGPIRWGVVLVLAGFHVFMKAPVWFLIGKLSDVMGGTGWHRSELIDAWIRHFDEWWLLGTAYTRHWMATGLPNDPNNTDLTNHFVRVGAEGGLITLLLFILTVAMYFSAVGRSLRRTGEDPGFPHFLWVLGTSLAIHLFSFLSVSYFDQMWVFYYFLTAVLVNAVSAQDFLLPSTPPSPSRITAAPVLPRPREPAPEG